jgi:Fic family protein
MQSQNRYIYQSPQWPQFHWEDAQLQGVLGRVRQSQGKINALMSTLGFTEKAEAGLHTYAMDLVKSSEIEGEHLDYAQVRSSLARKLGINTAGLVQSPRNVDGMVEILVDATHNHHAPLTHERLYSWHAALFPTGYSGLYRVLTGAYRTEEIQVVSGGIGHEKVHYQALPAAQVHAEMEKLLQWLEAPSTLDPVFRAGIAHFWFIIIHPFDDGNRRIVRALTDFLLARAEQSPERFYSLSMQMMKERKEYYAVLQRVQHSDGDITPWMLWFLQCLEGALEEANQQIQALLHKARFWQRHEHTPLNTRQRLILGKLLSGFEGKLQSSKWSKMAKCSPDTALRDIKDLVDKGILMTEESGGRSTSYRLVDF